MNANYEKLGLFYLGKHYNSAEQKIEDELLLYKSKHLVTHGVCIGMTGSGKTGLCVSILEEAAIDDVPVLIVDPKGDLTNLLLTFPSLSKEEFLPWVNSDEASKRGISVEELAEKEADTWKKGLADWGQTPERIKMFMESAERVLYTPGSSAAKPISILKSFDRPKGLDDLEVLTERVSALVSGLLGLVHIESEPLTSKEHIFLSNVIQGEWQAGKDVTIEQLISLIQKPPINKIGAFDLEAYYPKKERFKLATKINNLIASPQFSLWTKGDNIDIDNLLYTDAGKPKISILSIAHLSDRERMFFITLLLNELVSWMRTQSGTSSLRCLFYMDEIFGYLPPVANPPSKKLFLTLLKQARAFGVGLLLATQNPGDLDYKALGNVGTWFIGRLQTERDKEKVLEGLMTTNGGNDRGELSKKLAGLGKRVFMLNNISESQPVLFHTRWALSYLAGPIMRNRFKKLIGEQNFDSIETSAELSAGKGTDTESDADLNLGARPILNPDIPQLFIPGHGKVYEPKVLGNADILYKDRKLNINASREEMLVAPFQEYVDWRDSEPIDYTLDELETEPRDGFKFVQLDAEISQKKIKSWQTDLKNWFYKKKPLEVFTCPSLDAVSLENEDERAFRIRIAQEAREKRDEFLEKIRDDYEKEIISLEKARERAILKAETQAAQVSSHTLGTAISIGTSILSSLFSSRRGYSGIARHASKIGTNFKERREAKAAAKLVEEVEAKLLEIEEEIQDKLVRFQNSDLIEVERVEIFPKKLDINIRKVALSWQPVRETRVKI